MLTTRRRQLFLLLVGCCALALMLDVRPTPAQGSGPKATVVYGQPDFAGNDANQDGQVTATTMFFPLGIVIDSSGGIFVADRNNNRVLHFPKDKTTPDRVYGQFSNFTTNVKNNDGTGKSGAPSADNLNNPTALALDGKGGLYVADRDNHRILHFANDGRMTADRVYGQFGNFTTNLVNNDGEGHSGEPSAENIGTFTLGLIVDKDNGLYVSDSLNNRVLYFASDSGTKAVRVYGQFGKFNTGIKNNDGQGKTGLPTANGLNFPRGLALDSKGGLFVTDRDNQRILHFPKDLTTPDRVYGQFGKFTDGVANNNGNGNTGSGAASAENLFNPRYIAVDSSDGLYVADANNNRALYFANDGDTKADRVYGQFGSFTVNVLNNDGKGAPRLPSADNLAGPQGIAVGPDGRVYISDSGNNRVLMYEKTG